MCSPCTNRGWRSGRSKVDTQPTDGSLPCSTLIRISEFTASTCDWPMQKLALHPFHSPRSFKSLCFGVSSPTFFFVILLVKVLPVLVLLGTAAPATPAATAATAATAASSATATTAASSTGKLYYRPRETQSTKKKLIKSGISTLPCESVSTDFLQIDSDAGVGVAARLTKLRKRRQCHSVQHQGWAGLAVGEKCFTA